MLETITGGYPLLEGIYYSIAVTGDDPRPEGTPLSRHEPLG